MSLTRKMLKAMGIEDEKIDQIIDAHTETVDALKEQRDGYKKDAEQLPKVQKELDDLKEAGDGGYKQKYEDEHKAFEDYKTKIAEEKDAEVKKSLYRQLLEELKVDPKRIDSVLKVTDLAELKVKDGKLEDKDNLIESIKTEWADFIPVVEIGGADVDAPPGGGDNGDEPDLGSMSMKDYIEARKKM